MKILKIIGIVIALFGIADLIGSYAGYDLWTDYIGVQLPETLWNYSHYIEIAIGVVLYSIGAKDDEDEAEEQA